MDLAGQQSRSPGKTRWIVCGLLFAATAISYVDRQMIGVLKPTIQHDLGWSEVAYGDLVFWFQAAYAFGYFAFGRLIDRIGARAGYAVAMIVWTISHVAHGMVTTALQFALARIGLGLGESGGFPASLKAVSDWFPQKERALAVGLFNAGAAIGPIVTPLIVPSITLLWGWRMAFILTGAFSVLWLIAWWAFYRHPNVHPRVNAEELQHIQQDRIAGEEQSKDTTVSWLTVLGWRQTWVYAIGKFLTDPIWWMFLFWLPDFLGRRFGLDLKNFGPPLIAVYVLADCGSAGGGFLSSRLIKSGLSVNVARKTTMLICAVLVVPVAVAQFANQMWMAVAIISLAAAAHQAWSANLMTLPSDLVPKSAVGSVIGVGGMAGAIGGMLMSKYAGYILQKLGTYQPIFIVAASAYLVAFAIIHILSPRLERRVV